MSTYKVIQDIEAEDKLVGPLTLRQFIYAGIAAVCLYLTFLSATHHAAFLAVIWLPIAAFTGFFAFPFGKDQPTEVWALAKLRFFLKPRKRIWDQSGTKELVTVTVPKRVERNLTNGLSQNEVTSRLEALATTIDSRGWAVKNVNVNLSTQPVISAQSDRLVNLPVMPQEVSDIDVRPADDILDESANPIAQQFDQMITTSSQNRRQELIARMQQPSVPQAPQVLTPPAPPVQQAPAQTQPNDYWFMNQPAAPAAGQAMFASSPMVTPGVNGATQLPQAAVPTAEEQAMVEHMKQENASMSAGFGNMKTLQPLRQQTASQPTPTPSQPTPIQPSSAAPQQAQAPVTVEKQAAIMNLSKRDDLDVATLQRQAEEVVISLR